MDFLSLWSGLKLTLELLAVSAVLGLLVASCFTTVSFLTRAGKKVIDAYIFVMRGTPMLVQFYFIYYGLAEWGWVFSPIICSILALTLNTGAYTTVIFRGALSGIPVGEIVAAKALGFSRYQILKKITLPRVTSLILPVYSNEVLMLLKGTSLASTITVLELTGITEQLIGETYQTILYWLVAGGIYLAVSAVIIGVFKLLEWKFQV